MTPYMAQGAAQALEDAVVLTRSLADADGDIAAALGCFERCRQARVARVQAISHQNTWMRERMPAEWLYGYDASTASLDG